MRRGRARVACGVSGAYAEHVWSGREVGYSIGPVHAANGAPSSEQANDDSSSEAVNANVASGELLVAGGAEVIVTVGGSYRLV